MNRHLFHIVALILAANYFAFQVELFEEEYEQNHRPVSQTSAVGSPTVNWETFSKSEAAKAFVVTVETHFQLLLPAPVEPVTRIALVVTRDLVRDKSPPHSSLQ